MLATEASTPCRVLPRQKSAARTIGKRPAKPENDQMPSLKMAGLTIREST